MSSAEKQKNIYFIDQTSEFDHHMVFNASMLKILCKIFPQAKIYHCGLPSNIESVKTLLSPEEQDRITPEFIPHKKVSGGILKKGLNYLRKERYRYHHFKSILKRTTENDWIVLSITTFTSFLWFKRLKRNYQTPTIAVLHGDVDYIYKGTTKIHKINAWAHKKIFKTKAPNFYYLTLNKIEKAILVKDGYLKESEILEIEHPFLNLEKQEPRDIPNKPLTIGHIGSMEIERKNSHYLFKLAEYCKNLIESNKVYFKSVGLLSNSLTPYLNDYVELMVGNSNAEGPLKYLSRIDYENGLESLDYVIFFYPKDEYVFRASGAVADFIAKCKPIICLKHPIFEYMFDNAGNIGFMCDSLDDIQKKIQEITSDNYNLISVYKEQVKNLREYQKSFSIQYVSDDLKRQLNL
ncbi:hypothetical protein ACT724_06225 [Ornithobacterium rhinotracheale]|uniref:hypothetical protein n=1 Tax=Ornithobacterium rhinotracheale TaxID=28251 RepID=UPI004035C04C